MLDYSNGKIYKLWSFQTDEIYIGSTAQLLLCKRLADHKRDYKNFINGKFRYITSFKLIEYDDCKIELIENYPCDNKNELTAREGYYIRTLECVNKHIPGRTKKEWVEDNRDRIIQYREDNKEKMKEYNKEYKEANKEKILKNAKQYREVNKEQIAEKAKEYYKNNKEKIKQYMENKKDSKKEYSKKYREANKEQILEKAKEKITCECGCIIRKSHLTRHKKSKKHQEYINNL